MKRSPLGIAGREGVHEGLRLLAVQLSVQGHSIFRLFAGAEGFRRPAASGIALDEVVIGEIADTRQFGRAFPLT